MHEELHKALRGSEELYRSVFDAITEAVFLQDADAAILAANEAAERLFGLTVDQMTGRTSFDPRWRSIHEDGSPFPGETHPVPVALSTGEPQRDVIMGIHKPDGTLTWLSINCQPLSREGESKPYAVMSTCTDITHRKLAEEALRESEERYRRIIEATLEGVWTVDLKGNTTFANRRMAEIAGCTVEEFAKSNVWDFVDESDRPAVRERMAARARGVGEQHDFRLRRKDGTLVWTSMSASPITFPDGSAGALAMVRDLTEERRMQEELQRSREQLQQAQKLESIGRLAGGVAHDFNNLLTAILASVSFAEHATPDSLEDELGTIRSAAERAAELTRQLLAFARRQVIQVVSLDLKQTVAGLEMMLRRLLGEHIELSLELDPDPWRVRGDPSWVQQIIVNLAVNARDAMPDGGPATISLRNTTLGVSEHPEVPPGDYVVLSVEDAGSGIDKEALPHIFEPFYTSKEAGTGLGLASVYGVVKQLGGHITVSSESGQGSRFDVYLPRDREHETAAPPPKGLPAAKVERAATLLLVEDDEMLRRLVVQGLVRLGFDVLVAPNAEVAQTIAKEHPGTIHVIVTDVMLPGMSGAMLADVVQTLRPETRVLFVSGYADEWVESDGALLGSGRSFLPKPYRVDQLAERIDELVALPPGVRKPGVP